MACPAPPSSSTPLSYRPATGGGVNLEAALEGLDLDKIIKKEGLNLDLMEQLTLDHI